MTLYYDDVNAECAICRKVKAKSDFSPKKSRSKGIRNTNRTYRGVHTRCRECRELLRKEMVIPNPDAFWQLVNRNNPNICWPWMGRVDSNGYGVYSPGINDQQQAHRVSYFLSVGKLNKLDHILHECDNPICCNPNHLRPGSHLDNIFDKISKGRQSRRGKLEKMPVIDITVTANSEWKLRAYQILKRIHELYSEASVDAKNEFIENVISNLDMHGHWGIKKDE